MGSNKIKRRRDGEEIEEGRKKEQEKTEDIKDNERGGEEEIN
jgi:hypothetical protein